MGEVIELKTKRDFKYDKKCPSCGGCAPNYDKIWALLEEVEGARRYKYMTLWGRIFNWPHKEKDDD